MEATTVSRRAGGSGLPGRGAGGGAGARRAAAEVGRGAPVAGWRWRGPTSIRRSRWRPRRCSALPAIGVGSGTPRSRSPAPGRRWSRSSRVAEFAAAVGMTTDAGKYYLGQAVELRYRLPRLWAQGRERGPAGVEGPPDRPRDHQPRADRRGRGARGPAPGARWRTRSASPSMDRLVDRGDRPVHARDRRGHPRGPRPTAGTSTSTTTRSPSPAPA